MSEQGWRAFLAADGRDDWVALHGGATAVFRVASVLEARQLAEPVAWVPGLEESETDALLSAVAGAVSDEAAPR
jgi:4a-hydroxytetrahydrobiopterin dehydratase